MPEIRSAAASILLINALSLFDEAIEQRLSNEQSKRAPKLAQRLRLLNDRRDLQNYQMLETLRNRRNEVSHELGKDVSVEELVAACSTIQDQLVAWGMVDDTPPYSLYFERSQMRDSSTPGAFEHDQIVRVLKGNQPVCEWKQTVRFG